MATTWTRLVTIGALVLALGACSDGDEEPAAGSEQTLTFTTTPSPSDGASAAASTTEQDTSSDSTGDSGASSGATVSRSAVTVELPRCREGRIVNENDTTVTVRVVIGYYDGETFLGTSRIEDEAGGGDTVEFTNDDEAVRRATRCTVEDFSARAVDG